MASARVSTHDGVFVERLPIGEVQLPSQRYPNSGEDLLTEAEPERSETIKTQLLEPTRRRQFERMKKFERDVVRTQDTRETDMLSGSRAVSFLEEKLRTVSDLLKFNQGVLNFFFFIFSHENSIHVDGIVIL